MFPNEMPMAFSPHDSGFSGVGGCIDPQSRRINRRSAFSLIEITISHNVFMRIGFHGQHAVVRQERRGIFVASGFSFLTSLRAMITRRWRLHPLNLTSPSMPSNSSPQSTHPAGVPT
jgi:hypothetical protein